MANILTREEVAATGMLNMLQHIHNFEIEIPDKYDEIGEAAFMYSGIYRVVIPKTVKVIGKKAFKNCAYLRHVELHDGLETIEDYAFWGCSRLENLLIPSTVKNVGTNVFDGHLSIRMENEDSFEEDARNITQLSLFDTQSMNEEKKGFDAIAGLQELKDQLQSEVIDVIREPERAKKLGINIPNGLLLYGPPGCGKTYFAEKFAEEAGFNFQIINCSDIASIYVHGTQEEIAKVFKSAREKAPTVLFFDEIEAMIPNRGSAGSSHTKTETNEFLTQLNGCGKKGVFVIGATNRPLDIDPAALRAGRLEEKAYLPQPDFETRKAIFKIHLHGISVAGYINTEELAKMTEDYVSADIEKIVKKAGLMAFHDKENAITMDMLLKAIKGYKRTVSLSVIREHERIRDVFENQKIEERKSVGFE